VSEGPAAGTGQRGDDVARRSQAPPPGDDELLAAADALGERLEGQDAQLAVAESSTGGLIGHLLTDSQTASDRFLGGIISYSPKVKQRLLGVPDVLLERAGAVSAEVAEAMLQGVFATFPAATLAIAVTGLAGPGGDGEGKPVGLTYVAVGRRDKPVTCQRRIFEHDRDGNKRAAALMALRLASEE
jgi:nicotinamide-nucleotide amidase